MMYYKGTDLKSIDRNQDYKIKDNSISNLHRLGFRYKRSMSDAEDDVYEYSFPVYRYHMAISLEARFLLWQQSNILKIDVFDSTTHAIYGPWYNDESAIHRDVKEVVNRNISKEMKRLNIDIR